MDINLVGGYTLSIPVETLDEFGYDTLELYIDTACRKAKVYGSYTRTVCSGCEFTVTYNL